MAYTQFRWKISEKWLLNTDFLIWVGQVSILEKSLNDSLTLLCPISCFKKMETWPIHIKISIFNGHFTPIFHKT
jgi:hypothetical protein